MKLGLYVHIPFCVSKCPYCDFYSFSAGEEAMDAYVDALCASLARWQETVHTPADTLYLGGGTPSLLGARRLTRVIGAAREAFGLEGAEITMEANPADDLAEVLAAFAAAGGNRVSLGVQACNDRTLRALGRRHGVAQAEAACRAVRQAGIRRLSLDWMLAVPGQTLADIRRDADWLTATGAEHISAYLLKIEPGTPFALSPPTVPADDEAADLYLAAVAALGERGYAPYEISNFCRPGEESRHNLKYWNGDPYLGVGPAAHSFIGGRRFYYPRDIAAFERGDPPCEEEAAGWPAGSPEEYALLRLRLTEGLTEAGFSAKTGRAIPAAWRERAAALPSDLVTVDEAGIRLSPAGFLVSNAVIAQIVG